MTDWIERKGGEGEVIVDFRMRDGRIGSIKASNLKSLDEDDFKNIIAYRFENTITYRPKAKP